MIHRYAIACGLAAGVVFMADAGPEAAAPTEEGFSLTTEGLFPWTEEAALARWRTLAEQNLRALPPTDDRVDLRFLDDAGLRAVVVKEKPKPMLTLGPNGFSFDPDPPQPEGLVKTDTALGLDEQQTWPLTVLPQHNRDVIDVDRWHQNAIPRYRTVIILPTYPPQFGGWMDNGRSDRNIGPFMESQELDEWWDPQFAFPRFDEVQTSVGQPYETIDELMASRAMQFEGDTFQLALAEEPAQAPIANNDVIVMLRVERVGDFRFDGGDLSTMLNVGAHSLRNGERVKEPGSVRYRVVLRRSLTLEGDPVEPWFADAAEPGVGRDAVIAFYDGRGNALRVYELEGVYPMSLSVNDRNGLGAWGEEIELKADAIRRVR